MKRILTIVFIVFIGFALIKSVWNEPAELSGVGKWYQFIWSIGAILIGIFGTFFTTRFNTSNAKRFEKLYRMTRIPIFKKMAGETLGDDQKIVTMGVGIIFLVIGLIMFFGYLSAV